MAVATTLNRVILAFAVSGLVVGCDPAVKEEFISRVPAEANQLSRAQLALKTCADEISDFPDLVRNIAQIGFLETDQSVFLDEDDIRARIYADVPAGVSVMLALRGSQTVCIVAVESLTPQQSLELASPIAARFNAITNAERNNGLANNAVEAWVSFSADRNIYIAAYKTWESLQTPGAAVRILHLEK